MDRKFSGGLIFSGIMYLGELNQRAINSDLGTGYFETESLPTFGAGFYIEYHHRKHNFGLRQQTALHTWEYGSVYKDSLDENLNYVYYEGLTDYTEYKFNNFFASYSYSFIIAKFQPSLKMSVGYHNVQLSGYSSYFYNQINYESFYEDYNDQIKIDYWSLKPEIEGEFRFSKHMSAFVSLGFDFALSDGKSYEYDYDAELIEKGYVNDISRKFTPANYFEICLGVAFSF